jgi:hypothetical protein
MLCAKYKYTYTPFVKLGKCKMLLATSTSFFTLTQPHVNVLRCANVNAYIIYP